MACSNLSVKYTRPNTLGPIEWVCVFTGSASKAGAKASLITVPGEEWELWLWALSLYWAKQTNPPNPKPLSQNMAGCLCKGSCKYIILVNTCCRNLAHRFVNLGWGIVLEVGNAASPPPLRPIPLKIHLHIRYTYIAVA